MITWEAERRNTNPAVDLSPYVDLSNDGFTIPSNPEFNEVRLKASIRTLNAVTVDLFDFLRDGGSFETDPRMVEGRSNVLSISHETDWTPINAGETYTARTRFTSSENIEQNGQTFFSIEVR